MRRNEAYGVLLVVLGMAMLGWFKLPGLLLLLLGAGLIIQGLFRHRIPE